MNQLRLAALMVCGLNFLLLTPVAGADLWAFCNAQGQVSFSASELDKSAPDAAGYKLQMDLAKSQAFGGAGEEWVDTDAQSVAGLMFAARERGCVPGQIPCRCVRT